MSSLWLKKKIRCNYIFSQDILCTKTGHNIDDSFAMTCTTIRSNNSQVEFIGQLMKKSKGVFIFVLQRGIVTLNPKTFILDFIYRNHISYHLIYEYSIMFRIIAKMVVIPIFNWLLNRTI